MLQTIKMTSELHKLCDLCDRPELKTTQLGAQRVRAGGYPAYFTAAWVHSLAVGIDGERLAHTPKIQAAAIAAFKSIIPQILNLAANAEPRLLYLLPRISNLVGGKDFNAPLPQR